MSQTEKSAYYKALKAAGVNFPKHYREYSTKELKVAYDALREGQEQTAQPAQPPPRPAPVAQEQPPPRPAPEPEPEQYYDPEPEPEPDFDPDFQQLEFEPAPPPPLVQPESPRLQAPRRERDPSEMAGQRLNTKDLEEPIRTDELGRTWLQEEIRKPAYPKPRGRRVLTYMEQGVKQQTVRSGDYVETFEVAGDEQARVAEVKVTLPSYQVGIYRDARFPFKIHVYNEVQGFDLFEVQDYWGGAEQVPAECRRIYVENVLCYDIRTTVRAIEAEYRHLQLTGKVE